MKEVKRELLIRVYIVALAMVGVACMLFYKAAKISIVEGEHWRDMGDSLYLKYVPVSYTHLKRYSSPYILFLLRKLRTLSTGK